MTAFLMIFRRFLTTFWRFPKMFQNCSEGQTNAPKHFSETFRKFPKMSEDSQRLPKTFEKTRRCFDDTPTNLSTILRDKLDISEIIDIFTCEEIISSHVTISCRFYRSLTTRYTTDFYIVKMYDSNDRTVAFASKSNFKFAPQNLRLVDILDFWKHL